MRRIHLLILGLTVCCLQGLVACGKGSESSTSSDSVQIIGGAAASIEEFPFIVHLQKKGKHACGATLIHPQWVLTAAHCVLNEKVQPPQVETFDLVLGDSHIAGSQGLSLGVDLVVAHPEYNQQVRFSHDIALIKLQEPLLKAPVVKLNRKIFERGPRSKLVALGWGYTDNSRSGFAEHLQQVSLSWISNQECAKRAEREISDDMMCVGTSRATLSSCTGDSGGPLLLKSRGEWYQIGVTSFGAACNPQGGKSDSNTYSDVAFHAEWIYKVIKSL